MPERIDLLGLLDRERGADAEDRHVGVRCLHRGHVVAEPGERHRRRREDVVHVVIAAGCEIEEVDARLGAESRDDRAHGGAAESAGMELVGDDADADGEIVADTCAHRPEHVAGEARASLQVPAVAVRAGVVERREELVQQVAVRHVDLDAVEAAVPCQGGRDGPALDQLGDVGVIHLPGRVGRRRREEARRGKHRARPVGTVRLRLCAMVVELHEHATAGVPDRVRHAPVRGHRLGAEGILEPPDRTRRVDEVVPRDEQPAAAQRPAHEVRGLAVRLDTVGVQLGVGRLHQPVGDLDPPDPQRREQGRPGCRVEVRGDGAHRPEPTARGDAWAGSSHVCATMLGRPAAAPLPRLRPHELAPRPPLGGEQNETAPPGRSVLRHGLAALEVRPIRW